MHVKQRGKVYLSSRTEKKEVYLSQLRAPYLILYFIMLNTELNAIFFFFFFFFTNVHFQMHFLEWNVCISTWISLKFVSVGPVDNMLACIQVMVGHRGGDKLLSKLLLTQISRCTMTNCITNTQWVENLYSWHNQHKTSWLVNHELKKGNPLVSKDNFSDPPKHQPSLFISHDVNQHTLSNPSLGHISLSVFQISWK